LIFLDRVADPIARFEATLHSSGEKAKFYHRNFAVMVDYED